MREFVDRDFAALKAYIGEYRSGINYTNSKWSSDMVLKLCGKTGSGKTTLALSYCRENREALYFSFRHIEASLAPTLFSVSYPERFTVCSDWNSFFEQFQKMAEKNRPIIFFDDVDDRNDKQLFFAALQVFLMKNQSRHAFVILLLRKGEEFSVKGGCHVIEPLTLWDIFKLFPKLRNDDVLRLYSLTDGIPGLVSLYDMEKSYEENLCSFFQVGSAYYRYAETWLNEAFRSPESYNTLLYGMAVGHHRISELASFSGYPNNKCDKYLKALDVAGLIIQSQQPDETGRLRTHYDLRGEYMKVWYRCIFPDLRKYMQPTPTEQLQAISDQIDATVAREAFRAACFRWLKANAYDVYSSNFIRFDDYKQYDVEVNGCKFDFVQKDKERILFVKIWDTIGTHCVKEDLTELDEASSKANPYYNNQYVLFSIYRFSNYYGQAARRYDNLRLVELDNLKY